MLAPDQARLLLRIGAVCAWGQLATIVAMTVLMAVAGPPPETAAELFEIREQSRLLTLARSDLVLIPLVFLYVGTMPAILWALRERTPVVAGFATLLALMAAIGVVAVDTSFSQMHLGDRWMEAGSSAERERLLAAAEALLVRDMWHGTAAYMGGILLQGGGVMVSLAMLRGREFSKVTAWTGLVGNALDLLQHLLHPFAPEVAEPIKMVMGVPYLVWFPMLGRDLWRLSGRTGG